MRVGTGYDVHRLKKGRKLILGGVEIPYEKGLDGHSDADVLVHAIIDSLLGAAALGDIGTLFPDSDCKYKDISSLYLLNEVGIILKNNNYIIQNIDSIIIIEKPKMAPHISKMRKNISESLNIEVDKVNVKATTEEGLNFTGGGLGVSAQSICLIA